MAWPDPGSAAMLCPRWEQHCGWGLGVAGSPELTREGLRKQTKSAPGVTLTG